MITLINVKINQEKIKNLAKERIESYLNKNQDIDKLFYTMKDLEYITGFSRGHIENHILHDPEFIYIRRKSGIQWIFPVEETRSYLKEWVKYLPNE